eukprot:7143043-Ditylum_brightwellii.AAC.1
MDTALFKQHPLHFSQATGTLFTINPLLSTLGEYAETLDGEKFRVGTLNIETPPVDKYPKEFLKEIQQKPHNSPTIVTNIHMADIKRNYKHWKEATSMLPSGRYLSLYRMWINIPKEKDDDYKGITSDDFFQLVHDIIENATRIAYPLEHGASSTTYIF